MEEKLRIIPKPQIKIPFFVNFIFWLSFILCFVFVIPYFLLKIQINSLKIEDEKIKTQLEFSLLEKDLFEKLKMIKENIELFSDLSKKHRYTSKLLNFLKTLVHPRVQFTSLTLNNFPCLILEDFFKPFQFFFDVQKSQSVLTPYQHFLVHDVERAKILKYVNLFA